MRFMSSVKRETIFYSDRTGTIREKKRKARIWKPELPKLTGSCRLLLYLASAVLAALGISMIRFPWGSAQHVAGTGRETQNGIE